MLSRDIWLSVYQEGALTSAGDKNDLKKNSLKLSHSVCFFFCRLTDRTDFNLDICVGGLHVCNKMFSLQSMITITNSNLQYEYDVCELTGSGRNILTTMSYNRFTLTSRKFHSFFFHTSFQTADRHICITAQGSS